MENSENIATEENVTKKMTKSTFIYKNDDKRLLLSIHHTIKENDNLIRIRLIAGCFNDANNNFVTIDNRGNIFVFDLAQKKFWKLVEKITKASIIRNIPNKETLYLVGTKSGSIYWLDVEKSVIIHSKNLSSNRISNISFPGIPLSPLLAIVHSNHDAILINMETYEASHRLEFNHDQITLKFVAYVPLTDQIFSCFTNDSVHIWSGITLNTIRIHNPIRIRDRYLMSKEAETLLLKGGQGDGNIEEVNYEVLKKLSKGLINSFSFSADGTIICFTTLDNYLLLVSSVNFLLLKLIKVLDATLNATWIFPKPNVHILLCQTTKSQLVMIDIKSSAIKLVVENAHCYRVDVSKDRELLYVIKDTGDSNIYSLPALIDSIKDAVSCVQKMRNAMSQPKVISIGCFDMEMRELISKTRLIPILKVYGQYPRKYRNVIWTTILKLPCNKHKFLELTKMGIHPSAAAFDKGLQLKEATVRRNLVKIFSCLSHWTKVFGYSDFIPSFIFPFVKYYSSSLNVCFEVLATILTNQCQLWFEFHPLVPLNYLGMCENILNHFNPQLGKFYSDMGITAKEFAWAMLKNGFSEVLDEEHWLCLWDNVLSNAPYFLLFCVIAYNIVQRETIMKFSSKENITDFFLDQNAIDYAKFIKKAYILMDKCPTELHPQRYMKEFVELPKGVYPKFQNYPKKWVEMQETEMDAIRKEQHVIDTRIRELEQDEAIMMEKLERGLRDEEYSKRLKDMQSQCQEILKREEQRVNFQRKMLLLYQKELRNRKGKVAEVLEELAHRKKQHLQENEMNTLLGYIERGHQRSEVELMLAEEKIKDQEFMLLARQYEFDDMPIGTDCMPMRYKYRDAFDKLVAEKQKLTVDLQNMIKGDADEDVNGGLNEEVDMETMIRDLETEFQNTLKTKSKLSGF